MPPYPYGKNNHFPEANYGLYGGSVIVSGNKISKGRNKGKTVRKWFPNIRFEKIRSEALDTVLHIPIRARVMRTIKKSGGLDQYVLGDKPARIKELGILGWKIRWLVMTSPNMRKQFIEERAKYGLDNKGSLEETFEEVWNDEMRRQELVKLQDEAWEKLRDKDERYAEHVRSQWDTADKPTRLNADKIAHTRGSLHERTPSKMELPDLEALEITKSRRKIPQAPQPQAVASP